MFYTIGLQMTVNLLDLRAGYALPPPQEYSWYSFLLDAE
jgi:hypothetical protein